MTGLIEVNSGSGKVRWEIYHLLVDSGQGFRRVVQELLEHLSVAAVEDRVPFVLLRLNEASPAVQPALRSNYVHYGHEEVYLPGPTKPVSTSLDQGIRARQPADDHALFLLYCAMRPAAVRQYEGLTMLEWRRIDGWGVTPIGLQRLGVSPRRDFVMQIGDSLAAWIQIDRYYRTIRVEMDVPARPLMDDIIDFANGQLGDGSHLRWIVRDHQGWLGRELGQRGLQPDSTHLLLARPLAIRVPEPELMPMRA